MLQDGARRNNSLAPKGLGQEKKKHSCKRCAETTKGGWRRFSVRDLFLSWSLPYLPVLVRLVGLIVKR